MCGPANGTGSGPAHMSEQNKKVAAVYPSTVAFPSHDSHARAMLSPSWRDHSRQTGLRYQQAGKVKLARAHAAHTAPYKRGMRHATVGAAGTAHTAGQQH
eukprot:3332329-Prymnesium_polylepis.2